ncbi:hypothetical protein DRQ15_02255 [candidate division KSB1 bacterium]|nr:hypothetical protein [bacterium]OQX59585.1 MAG: hypothetical protein B5M50_02575 [candidate division KSB1 bacterium 4484_219]RKY77463.1 MAG: hypothetical protein DRQ00_06895 [candidate division KSB1 bacterium]RKY80219.1 MAG: hypothetical protein DRQ12_01725 [candidate division KSB1 bacterium]RKY85881.1 MAG: hypothetical protein DRP98_01795 [candidate division KSB1 bacterium]
MPNNHSEKEKLLQKLEELLERLSIPLRQEKGNFKGGLCRLYNQRYFVLNKSLPIEVKLQIYRTELQKLDLQNVFLQPIVRQFLEET